MSGLLLRLSTALRARPLLVVPLFLCLYGYGTIDVTDYYRLSAHPLQLNADPGRQFLHSSALTYFLGYPLTSTLGPKPSFALVMLGGVALFAFSLRRLTTIRYSARANDALLMFLAAPLLIVMTQYLGKSDAYLASSFFLLLSASNPFLQMVAAALVVVSHLEIGTLVLAISLLLGLTRPRTVIAGAIAAIALVYVYQYALLSAVPQSRADLGASYLLDAIAIALTTPVTHIVWTFGPFWWCVWRAWPLNGRWLAAAATALGFAVATLDFTRVFILIALPALVAVVDRVVAELPDPTAPDQPRWLAVLPLFAFCQAHLLSLAVFDSRIPDVISRLLGSSYIRH